MEPLYWYPFYGNAAAQTNSTFSSFATNSILKSLTYNVTNSGGQLKFIVTPATNVTGQAAYTLIVSSSSSWYQDYEFGLSLPPYYYLTFFFTYGAR